HHRSWPQGSQGPGRGCAEADQGGSGQGGRREDQGTAGSSRRQGRAEVSCGAGGRGFLSAGPRNGGVWAKPLSRGPGSGPSGNGFFPVLSVGSARAWWFGRHEAQQNGRRIPFGVAPLRKCIGPEWEARFRKSPMLKDYWIRS